MKVKVLAFAEVRERMGRGDVDVAVPEGSSPEVLWRLLLREHPSLGELAGKVRPAVNEAYAAWDASLSEGDRVAFLSPPGGG